MKVFDLLSYFDVLFFYYVSCKVRAVSLFVTFILFLLLTEEPQKNFVMVLKLKREFKQVYENLENSETKMLVRGIEENVSALVMIIIINFRLVL